MDHVEVDASVDTSLDFQLQVTGTAQSVMVEASTSTVQSESAELSADISNTEIKQLPIGSLNPISLVLTEPGVVSVARSRQLHQWRGLFGGRPAASFQ